MTDSFKDNPGEKLGSLVEAKVGKGRWIYLGLGLWRQLPAGTDGAYQLLENLISLPKAPAEGVSAKKDRCSRKRGAVMGGFRESLAGFGEEDIRREGRGEISIIPLRDRRGSVRVCGKVDHRSLALPALCRGSSQICPTWVGSKTRPVTVAPPSGAKGSAKKTMIGGGGFLIPLRNRRGSVSARLSACFILTMSPRKKDDRWMIGAVERIRKPLCHRRGSVRSLWETGPPGRWRSRLCVGYRVESSISPMYSHRAASEATDGHLATLTSGTKRTFERSGRFKNATRGFVGAGTRCGLGESGFYSDDVVD